MEKKKSNKLKTAAKVVGAGAAAYLAHKHGGKVVKAIHDKLNPTPTKWERVKSFAAAHPAETAYGGLMAAHGLHAVGKVAKSAYKGHKYLPRNTKRIAKVIGLSPAEHKKIWHFHGGSPESSATATIPGTGQHVLIGAHTRERGDRAISPGAVMAHELSHIKHGHSKHSVGIATRAVRHLNKAGNKQHLVAKKYGKVINSLKLRHEAEASSGLVTGGKGKKKAVSRDLRYAFSTYVKGARATARTGMSHYYDADSKKKLGDEYKTFLKRYSKFKKAGGLSKEGYKSRAHLKLSSAAEKGNLIEVLSEFRRKKVLECIRSFAAARKNLMEAPRINLGRSVRTADIRELRRTRPDLLDKIPSQLNRPPNGTFDGFTHNILADTVAHQENTGQRPSAGGGAVNWAERSEDAPQSHSTIDRRATANRGIKRRLRSRGIKVKESAANEGGLISRAIKKQLEG